MSPNKRKLLNCLRKLVPDVDVSRRDLQAVRQHILELKDTDMLPYVDNYSCAKNFLGMFLWPDEELASFMNVLYALRGGGWFDS